MEGGVNPSLSAAADICLYDKSKDKLIIVPGSDFSAPAYPSYGYSPVGVVVVPGTHNVYGDGSCGVMSLKEMNYTTPDTGSTSYVSINWGNYNVDISSITNYNVVAGLGLMGGDIYDTIQITKDTGYLPSNKGFKGKDCPHDTDLKYYNSITPSYCYIPSLYLTDDSRNPAYYQTSSPSSTSNAMSDFDGVGNTKKIIDLATGQSNWKTAPTITNANTTGYYPTACCCWRYHTDGTKQGDWYLPACGELGYIIPKFNKINQSINALIGAYSIGVQLHSSYVYWSSSECNSSYTMSVYTYDGRVLSNLKMNTYYVRAWLRVRA